MVSDGGSGGDGDGVGEREEFLSSTINKPGTSVMCDFGERKARGELLSPGTNRAAQNPDPAHKLPGA